RMPTKQPSHRSPILERRPHNPRTRQLRSSDRRRRRPLDHGLTSTPTPHFFVVRVTRVGSDPVVGASRHRRRTRRRRAIPITRHRHRTFHHHPLTYTALLPNPPPPSSHLRMPTKQPSHRSPILERRPHNPRTRQLR